MNEQLDFFKHILLGVTLGGGGVSMEFHVDLGWVISRSMFLKIIPPAPMGNKKCKVPNLRSFTQSSSQITEGWV